jgi:hypothetical protein
VKDKINAYKNFVGNIEVNGPVGRSKRKWKGNIEIDLKENMTECEIILILFRVSTRENMLLIL